MYTLWLSNSTPRYELKRNASICSPKKKKKNAQCITIFIEAYFTIAQNRILLKYPSIVGWISKLQNIHTIR